MEAGIAEMKESHKHQISLYHTHGLETIQKLVDKVDQLQARLTTLEQLAMITESSLQPAVLPTETYPRDPSSCQAQMQTQSSHEAVYEALPQTSSYSDQVEDRKPDRRVIAFFF